MSNLTVDQALQMAKAHQQAGQLSQAEALCRQLLHVLPRQPDALHLLGVIAHQTNHLTEARDLISQAIAINAANPAFYLSLGEVYLALGQADDAAAALHRALKIDPGCAAAYFLLAVQYRGRHRLDEAIAHYQKALALAPDMVAAHVNLGAAFLSQGRLGEAVACYQRALAVNPSSPEAHYNLGIALMAQEQTEAAIACFQKATDLQPAYADAWNNLGAALLRTGHFDEARKCLKQALTLRPDNIETHRNLGNLYFNAGATTTAIDFFRQVVRLAPDNPSLHSILIFALHFNPNVTAQQIFDEHRNWDQEHGRSLQATIHPHPNDADPKRPLRIGYVSPDFSAHVCGRFLLSLLQAHDHTQVQVYCYASVRRPDHITERLKHYADVWRDALALSDADLAQQIRDDGIDILVDLTMHMTNNRMPLFARKPAPVQVTYLAYASTTGLETMDYRITDPYLDPPSSDDSNYAETSIRLPQTFWCYPPPDEAPDVTPLPALSNGFVTFGCFNNFAKVNAQVLTLWAKLLRVMPTSQLVLSARPGSHREQTQARLAADGVHRERVRFVDMTPLPEYFANHAQTDIALDPFPYAGGTTSCDALWMGVPVVTLAGKTAVGRGGVSILSNIGLPELIAHSEEQYVKIAVELAQDLPRLSDLRATMRARMLASPLMDGPRFARGMEDAYRQMWTHWCEGRTQ